MNTIVNPGQFIVDIYNIALMVGGFLAFGAVVYGAISYSVAAGNPGAQTEAKEWITQALLGLCLLFGAYMVLYTIDSDLPNKLGLPPLDPLPALPPGSGNSAAAGCLGGECAPITGIPQIACKAGSGCSADARLVHQLQCLYNRTPAAPNITVTEAMPPTITHDDPGHQNGCAIDVVINGGVDCAKVDEFISIANKCSLGPYNEYTGCPGGHHTPHAVGTGHVHLHGC